MKDYTVTFNEREYQLLRWALARLSNDCSFEDVKAPDNSDITFTEVMDLRVKIYDHMGLGTLG